MTVRDRYQLLLAEGSMSDANLIVHKLMRAGMNVDFQRIDSLAQMQLALQTRSWDFIIFAQHLAGFDWRTALALCNEKGLDIPFIMVSETRDADPGVPRIKAGVHEHLLKGDLARLPQALRRELRSAQERWIRNHAEATSRFLRASCGAAIELAVIGLALDGVVVSWNSGAERLYGYSASEMIGRAFVGYDLGEAFAALNRQKGRGQEKCIEMAGLKKDGSPVRVQIAPRWIEDRCARIIGTSIVVRDLGLSEPWLDIAWLVETADSFGLGAAKNPKA